jgi:energy-coupling factor transport system permease protein
VLRAALLTAAPFWFFLFLLHGVGGMLTTAPRLTTMIASFFWLVAVLPPARLVEAMVAAGWPASAAFLLSATLSAVPALRERARRIVDAQRCRGLKTRGGPWARFTALRALALPLVLSALHEVDERALALETRGFSGSVRRTPLAPPPDSTRQRALRWGLLLGCLGLLAWRFV